MLDRLERSIEVTFRHQVYFTERIFGPGNPVLREVLKGGVGRRARVMVVVDEGLAGVRPDFMEDLEAWFAAEATRVELAGPPVRLEGGERVKNAYFHVSQIHERVERMHLDRQSYLMAIGGGALLDMVGLAAATAHRGLRHVRLPSTTLSQADSGVGVKNGINAFGKKNFIGTFAPPQAVINDFDLLRTLGERDRRAGYAEAVKVACIRDRSFFEWMEMAADDLARFERGAMEHLIRRSAELHLDHIAGGGDPFEWGSARPLDFGHWSAHKLEPLSDYRIRHGEAVAMGLALDVLYSRHVGMLEGGAAERVLRLLERLGFDLYANELHYVDSDGSLVLWSGLEEFREHLGGELTITLLRELGRGEEVHVMERSGVVAALEGLRSRHERLGATAEVG